MSVGNVNNAAAKIAIEVKTSGRSVRRRAPAPGRRPGRVRVVRLEHRSTQNDAERFAEVLRGEQRKGFRKFDASEVEGADTELGHWARRSHHAVTVVDGHGIHLELSAAADDAEAAGIFQGVLQSVARV